ncbi:hypothetical protein U0070_027063 [Myodes glareolus]|uniref:Cell cycle checkpoint protein RAD17 n=1 Tax=Myodes glareolus TaxID=447135 RepID=A0AAW0HHZ9_MYOGA
MAVTDWVDPSFDGFSATTAVTTITASSLDSKVYIVPYQSQTAVFNDFLLRATKYSKLQMLGDDLTTDKKIILVEDLPNQFYRDSHALHEILRKYVQIGRCPLVFIISDSVSGDNNQRLLFPKKIQEECSISNISFNPVAPTIMMKFLNRIMTVEASKNGGRVVVPDKTSLELLCQGCSGDIRSAINSLQFSSSKGAPLTESDSPRLPAHLSEHERDTLLVQPEEIVEMSHMPGDFFNLYLHQNYIDFFVEVDDLVRASEFLSFADVLGGDWNYRENCLAAKALFFDFCLPALCLQTQLLPYLALLTIPMRNKGNISFIQDIGRLPLKRNFGRLKMEALTERELIEPDSEDELQRTGGQTADPEPWSLPLSQNSGSDLPASQPQPFSSRVDMEEEEEEDIIIEDYDSDGT